jgi:hypothetical protein
MDEGEKAAIDPSNTVVQACLYADSSYTGTNAIETGNSKR